MEVGRYTVRSTWSPVSLGDRVLVDAVIEFEEGGTVFVHVGGEPLFAFPHREAFFGAHSLGPGDLVRDSAAFAVRAALRKANPFHVEQTAKARSCAGGS